MRFPWWKPQNDPTKKLKSKISEMEARQTKMYEAMANVQTTSIAAIQATTASPNPKSADFLSAPLALTGHT